MKITPNLLRKAVRISGVKKVDGPYALVAVVDAVLALPEVREQILREETGGGQSSLFGGAR